MKTYKRNEENNTIELTIYCKEVKMQDDNGRVRTFCTYTFKNSKGEYFDVKFRKEVDIKPSSKGYFKIEVPEDSFNTHRYAELKYGRVGVMWIGCVIASKRDEEYENFIKEQSKQETMKALDGLDWMD